MLLSTTCSKLIYHIARFIIYTFYIISGIKSPIGNLDYDNRDGFDKGADYVVCDAYIHACVRITAYTRKGIKVHLLCNTDYVISTADRIGDIRIRLERFYATQLHIGNCGIPTRFPHHRSCARLRFSVSNHLHFNLQKCATIVPFSYTD